GMRKPLHCTGLGKAFLSFEEEDVRRELLESIALTPYTSHTITNREALAAVTSEYRAQGFAMDDEENDIGVYCVAAPVFGDAGGRVGASSWSGSRRRMIEEGQSVSEEITRAAGKISETQGYTGGVI